MSGEERDDLDKKEDSPAEKNTEDVRTGKRVQMIPFFPLTVKKVFCRVASCSRKLFSPSHMLLLWHSSLLCETYPGKLGNRELFLPSGDFMEADTPMC